MPKNLRWKWIVIFVVVLASIIGLTGFPTSTRGLKENLDRNIRLGLDLKGGSHIVLQIQVQDAFKAEADAVIERLKEMFRKENIAYASIERNDPESIETANTIQITIRGVPADRSSDFRRVVNEAVAEQWTICLQ